MGIILIDLVIKKIFEVELEVILYYEEMIKKHTMESYIITHWTEFSHILEFILGLRKQFSKEIKTLLHRVEKVKIELNKANRILTKIKWDLEQKRKICHLVKITYAKTYKHYTTLVRERTVIIETIKRTKKKHRYYINLEIKHIDEMLRLSNAVLRESLSSRRLNFKFINKCMKMFGTKENHVLKVNTRITKEVLRKTRTVLQGSIAKLQNLIAKTFWEIQKLVKRKRQYDTLIKIKLDVP